MIESDTSNSIIGNSKRPAIVAVGYDRPNSLLRLLSSIEQANYSGENITLIISLDKSDCEDTMVKVCENFSWTHGNKIIRTFPTRQGLKKHVLSCGDLSEEYGAVIILEDDLMVSPNFYNYTEAAISFYENEDTIAGFALYSYKLNSISRVPFEPIHNGFDSFLAQLPVSWGQCWTDSRWKAFRKWLASNPTLTAKAGLPQEIVAWDDKSWSKLFCNYMITENKYYVMPYEALSTCFSEAGEHAQYTSCEYQVPILAGTKEYRFAPLGKAVKYDMFFEYIFEKINISDYILAISGEEICVDLNRHKALLSGEHFLLTTGKCNYQLITEYSLSMKPMEANVLNELIGKGIYLYKLPENEEKIQYSEKKDSMSKLLYDLETTPWRKALRYSVHEIKYRLLAKIKNRQ